MESLPRSFFVRPTIEVALDLVGMTLVHELPDGAVAGRIVEVEAYLGEGDPASHAFRGPRGRAELMFRVGGVAYVYMSYGVHHCFNVVTDRSGVGGAVLVRAVEPLRGIELMQARRGRTELWDLGSGPGKLAQALGIGPTQNGLDLISSQLRVVGGTPAKRIAKSPRIGITQAADWPLRFVDADSAYRSR
jgi:DNA-3-methyladenine glycosylase